jgi:TolB-like protein
LVEPERAWNKPSALRLSIVVLPFANLSGDPEQEYFVDGVIESLTTDLSRITGLFATRVTRHSPTRANPST